MDLRKTYRACRKLIRTANKLMLSNLLYLYPFPTTYFICLLLYDDLPMRN